MIGLLLDIKERVDDLEHEGMLSFKTKLASRGDYISRIIGNKKGGLIMSEYIAALLGMVTGNVLMLCATTAIMNQFLKNTYLSVLAGYGLFFLVIRILLGGFDKLMADFFYILIADFIAIGIVLLIFLQVNKKKTKTGSQDNIDG